MRCMSLYILIVICKTYSFTDFVSLLDNGSQCRRWRFQVKSRYFPRTGLVGMSKVITVSCVTPELLKLCEHIFVDIRLQCATSINNTEAYFLLDWCNLARGSEGTWIIQSQTNHDDIFRVTGPLCGEFTGTGEFPTQRPVTRSFDVFFDLCLNKRLSKQPWGWWFETPSWSLWIQCND